MAGVLEGKVALVTGAGSGIGRATALAFSREGAKVVVADITVEGGNETFSRIKNAGGEAMFVKADVSKAKDVEAMIKTAVDTYGRIDCAHNNAGIEGIQAPTADCTEENWDRVLAINLKSVFLCMKYEIREMLKTGGGTIVNTASIAGLIGFATSPAYCASKGGIVQLTKAAALEYAKNNIRINCVCPGIIKTPMIERATHGSKEAEAAYAAGEPVGRLGKPEEIADAVIWLSSEKSSFVTGIPLTVDGGWTAQ